VEEQYRRDVAAVHGEAAAGGVSMDDEYKSFLRDLGGDVPHVPRCDWEEIEIGIEV
jgi:hypothetical protein